jgi:NADPH2:quinone reductase
LKNISVMGLHWGGYRTREPATVGKIFEGLYEFYRKGQIKPVIFKTYPLADLPIALGELASRKTYGKLIIKPWL